MVVSLFFCPSFSSRLHLARRQAFYHAGKVSSRSVRFSAIVAIAIVVAPMASSSSNALAQPETPPRAPQAPPRGQEGEPVEMLIENLLDAETPPRGQEGDLVGVGKLIESLLDPSSSCSAAASATAMDNYLQVLRTASAEADRVEDISDEEADRDEVISDGERPSALRNGKKRRRHSRRVSFAGQQKA